MTMHSPIAPQGAPIERRRDRLVRLPEVKERVGLSRTTIYRKMERGEFPGSVPLGANAVAWRESELERWIAAPMEWAAAA